MALPVSRTPTSELTLFTALSHDRNLLSRRLLQQLLGVLWLIDGLLQLQPSMWTMTFITGIMQPALAGQPGPIVAALQTIITQVTPYHVAANAVLVLVQLSLGVCLLFGQWVRPALVASVLWSVLVWIGGEGLGMLLTGQTSTLNGAPGAVLFYGVLALAAYPNATTSDGGLLARRHLRWVLAGFWALTAGLQLQPVWWQSQQIAHMISAAVGAGTLNGALVGPSLQWLAGLTNGIEVPLNGTIVVMALGLACGLAWGSRRSVPMLLVVSVLFSLLLWWATEGFGLLLSGTATDVNSGPLLVLLTLACWSRKSTKGSDLLPNERSDRSVRTSVSAVTCSLRQRTIRSGRRALSRQRMKRK